MRRRGRAPRGPALLTAARHGGPRRLSTWWRGSLPGVAMQRARDLDLDTHALALCAQQVLCVAPLVVAISAVLQRAIGEDMGKVTAKFFGLKHEAADAVIAQLGRSAQSISTAGLVVSLITAIVFSTSVGGVQQRAFELIWSQPRVRGLRAFARQLLWALGLAAFSLAMLFASALGKQFNKGVIDLAFVTGMILQSILVFAFYLWSQHWLLDGRVGVRSFVPGALAIAIGTAIMFRASREIIPQQIIWQTHAYGAIGVVFVLSAWLMVLCMVIFGGAVLGALIADRRAQVTDHVGVGEVGTVDLSKSPRHPADVTQVR